MFASLEDQQPERLRLGDIDNFHRCRFTIERLRKLAGHLESDSDCDDIDKDETKAPSGPAAFQSFDIILDDPAGNSFIENPFAPKDDPFITKTTYLRSPMQDLALGLQPSKEALDAGFIDESNPSHVNVVNTKPEGKHLIDIHMTKAVRTDDDCDDNDGYTETEPLSVGNLGKQEVYFFLLYCSYIILLYCCILILTTLYLLLLGTQISYRLCLVLQTG